MRFSECVFACQKIYCALVEFAVQPDCRPPARYFPGGITVNPGGLQYNRRYNLGILGCPTAQEEFFLALAAA